jgi:adenosine deaminase
VDGVGPHLVNIQTLPKILLHDHLDGGLRVDTVLDLADAIGHPSLPATDEGSLADWFDQSGSGSLDRYLEAFTHTIAVMQTAEALEVSLPRRWSRQRSVGFTTARQRRG